LLKHIKKISINLYKFCRNYVKGEYQKLSKIIFALGFVILILVINNLSIFHLSIHIEVNIGVPIVILVIGYLPLLNPKRKSCKENLTRQLDLLEMLLLAFFIALDSRALLDLFPGDTRNQITVLAAGILLMLILIIKVMRYRDTERR